MFWTQGILVIGLTVFTVILLIGGLALVARGHASDASSFALGVILAGSVLTCAAGAAQVLSPLFSAAFGRDFTYDIVSPVPMGPPPSSSAPVAPVAPALPLTNPAEDQYRNDLVNGVAILAVGLLLIGTLTVAGRFLRRQRGESSLLQRTYLLLILVATSLVAPISLAIALTQLLRRYVVLPVTPNASLPHPGSALATAIIFVPMWGWFLFRVLREHTERPAEAVPDVP